MPDLTIFGTADPQPLIFPKVRELLNEHRCVIFEIDQLIQHAHLGNTAIYQKGIAAWEHEPGLVELCEVMVEHPGLDLTRASLAQGWYYRVAGDGNWSRENHADDCNCGSQSTHLRHVSALHIIEAYLQRPEGFAELQDEVSADHI